MADFSPGSRALSIHVDCRAGQGKHRIDRWSGTDQVQHRDLAARGCITEGKVADGAEMIGELAGYGALDGPMAGVVNARRHLVRQELSRHLKELDRKDAPVIEGIADARGNVASSGLQFG